MQTLALMVMSVRQRHGHRATGETYPADDGTNTCVESLYTLW